MKRIFIEYYVDQVSFPGVLNFELMPSQKTYQSQPKKGWNSIIIDKEDVSTMNDVIVYASSGRFEISQLRVRYE